MGCLTFLAENQTYIKQKTISFLFGRADFLALTPWTIFPRAKPPLVPARGKKRECLVEVRMSLFLQKSPLSSVALCKCASTFLLGSLEPLWMHSGFHLQGGNAVSQSQTSAVSFSKGTASLCLTVTDFCHRTHVCMYVLEKGSAPGSTIRQEKWNWNAQSWGNRNFKVSSCNELPHYTYW